MNSPLEISIQDALRYDPVTGRIYWKISISRYRAGTVAGKIKHDGYLEINFRNKSYRSHRIAWLLMTGKWPEVVIDHRNSDKLDNRWANLREATFSQNSANCKPRNRELPKGVFFSRSGRFLARIGAKRRSYYLGTFETPAEASAAYAKAAAHHFGEFARSS